jgi:hypothetical protein
MNSSGKDVKAQPAAWLWSCSIDIAVYLEIMGVNYSAVSVERKRLRAPLASNKNVPCTMKKIERAGQRFDPILLPRLRKRPMNICSQKKENARRIAWILLVEHINEIDRKKLQVVLEEKIDM